MVQNPWSEMCDQKLKTVARVGTYQDVNNTTAETMRVIISLYKRQSMRGRTFLLTIKTTLHFSLSFHDRHTSCSVFTVERVYLKVYTPHSGQTKSGCAQTVWDSSSCRRRWAFSEQEVGNSMLQWVHVYLKEHVTTSKPKWEARSAESGNDSRHSVQKTGW